MSEEIIFLDCVDSTNTYAKMHFNELSDGVLVVAREQTAGRGRQSRRWFSPPDCNIYASWVVKNCQRPFWATVAGGLAVLDVLKCFAPEAGFFIKWPNDIYAREKKIAGLLSESIPGGVITGMGININLSVEQLNQIDQPATSLAVEAGVKFNLEKIVSELAFALKRRYIIYSNFQEKLVEDWKEANFLIGKEIELDDGRQILRGIMRDLAADGSMIFACNGNEKAVYAGDVRIVKESIRVALAKNGNLD